MPAQGEGHREHPIHAASEGGGTQGCLKPQKDIGGVYKDVEGVQAHHVMRTGRTRKKDKEDKG